MTENDFKRSQKETCLNSLTLFRKDLKEGRELKESIHIRRHDFAVDKDLIDKARIVIFVDDFEKGEFVSVLKNVYEIKTIKVK